MEDKLQKQNQKQTQSLYHTLGRNAILEINYTSLKKKKNKQELEFPLWVSRLRTCLASVPMWVRSLVLLSGLRIQACGTLQLRLQVQLRSRIVVACGVGLQLQLQFDL